MKSMTFAELDQVVSQAQSYIGFSVTEVILSKNVLAIGFYISDESRWIVVDTSPNRLAFLVGKRLPRFKKEVKPLFLFLKAHLKGLKLKSVERQKEYGRVIELQFDGLGMTVQLTPMVRNIIVKKEKAQLSLNKLKELKPVVDKGIAGEARSPETLFKDWVGETLPKAKVDNQKNIQKKIKKKEQDLDKLKLRLGEIDLGLWRRAAEVLSSQQSLDVGEEWLAFIDKSLSLPENIQACFDKAKLEEGKREGLVTRIEAVLGEIDVLKTNPESLMHRKKTSTLFKDAKGRTKQLDEGVVAYVGKSAKDNLKLLRAAKAWHLWLHIKDRPGAYGIITRDKKTKVKDQLLMDCARWVLEMSLSDKQAKDWVGAKLEFVVSECRYVTPIKGDKIGRVNYKNEQVFSVIVD